MRGDALQTATIGPGRPLAEPIPLAAGEAFRATVNALAPVDLIAYLGIDDADLDGVDATLGQPFADEIRDLSANEDPADRYGSVVPSGTVLVLSTSADGWDESLTPESALPDDVNVADPPAFYEARLGWVAPTDGVYRLYVVTDDPTEVEYRVETQEDVSAASSLTSVGAGIFDVGSVPETFPAYSEFLRHHISDAVTLVRG